MPPKGHICSRSVANLGTMGGFGGEGGFAFWACSSAVLVRRFLRGHLV